MKIFLSYTQKDKQLADSIIFGLLEQGHLIINPEIEFSSNNKSLEERLLKIIKDTDVLIIIYTENAKDSYWINYEYGVFSEYVKENPFKTVIPISFDNALVPFNIFNLNIIDGVRDNISDLLLRLNQIISSFEGKRIFQQEKIHEIKQKIEQSSSSYVEETLRRLGLLEIKYKSRANFWYLLGYSSIIIGIMMAIWFAVFGPRDFDKWQEILFISIKTAIIIILLLASSKYCFNLAKTYMNEALKNSDRIHAISFGKFYMQVFGDNIDSKDLKDVFREWNLDKPSEFVKMNSKDYDPQLIEMILKTIDVVNKEKK